jgi:hypothetical protein
MTTPKFSLGQVVATPGALEALAAAGLSADALLARHLAGDWGDLDAEDKRLNDEAVLDGSRIVSAFTLPTGERLYCITEAENDQGQRASTCLLRREEY